MAPNNNLQGFHLKFGIFSAPTKHKNLMTQKNNTKPNFNLRDSVDK